jgi:hypothetical protein
MFRVSDYADAGGTRENRIAILDTNTTEPYTLTNSKTMNEVLSILGPTPNTG